MAWISGWRSLGGETEGDLFPTQHGSVDSVPWMNAPGRYGNYKVANYHDQTSAYLTNGVEIPRSFFMAGIADSVHTMAIFDISGTEYDRCQLVLKLQFNNFSDPHNKGFSIGIFKRIWTGQTYTDSQNDIWVSDDLFFNDQVVNNYMTDSVHMVVGYCRYNNTNFWLAGFSTKQTWAPDGTLRFFGGYWCLNSQDFNSWLGGDIPGEDASPEFGPESQPEGYTGYNFDDHSDTIDMPTKPQSVLSLGFVNVYKCEANALHDFGAALFPEISFPTSLSDVGEVIAAVSDSIWNSKLIDYVISVHCVPGNVTGGNLEDIKVGARTMTGILGRKITDEYVDVDFGSINTAQLFRNFADYMCQCDLWLPFYGFVSLKPEEWNGGTISVKYRINVIDGSFTAFVFATSNKSKLNASLIGEYGGSCVVHLPVSNLSYSSMFSSLIGGGAAAAMGLASGGASMVAGALAASNSVISAAAGGDTKKSNSYNASSSFMTRRKPYLIISAPVPSFSKRYAVENGLPSNVSYTLSQCKGYTVVDNPILDNIPCTADEKERIRNYLQSGVIIK